MAILKLYEYPDEVLRQKCERVSKIDDELRKFLDNMLETMYADKGCGLAAPQVGVTKRIIVLDPNPSDEDLSLRRPMYLVNPEIVWRSDETVLFNEGCLSLPNQRADVERYKCVRVHYTDYNGKEQEILADDLLAIILQHEIDHLDGVLYIDHLSRLKRSRLLKKLEKFREEKAQGNS
ncbi:MAG: peptide deformylase [Alphaproteobacteria bacterium]|nr:peptide deformylase [Alphaproteobacteria bacterium]